MLKNCKSPGYEVLCKDLGATCIVILTAYQSDKKTEKQALI